MISSKKEREKKNEKMFDILNNIRFKKDNIGYNKLSHKGRFIS